MEYKRDFVRFWPVDEKAAQKSESKTEQSLPDADTERSVDEYSSKEIYRKELNEQIEENRLLKEQSDNLNKNDTRTNGIHFSDWDLGDKTKLERRHYLTYEQDLLQQMEKENRLENNELKSNNRSNSTGCLTSGNADVHCITDECFSKEISCMESDEEVKENKSLKNKTGENHIKIDSEPNEVQFSDYGAGLSNAANLGRRHYEGLENNRFKRDTDQGEILFSNSSVGSFNQPKLERRHQSSSASRQINGNIGQQNEISAKWNSTSNDETSTRQINQQLYRMELDNQIKEKKALDVKREALQVIKESSSSSRQINANMGQQNEISAMWNSKDNLFEYQTLENFDTESVVSKRSSNDETSTRHINQQLYRMELDNQIKEKKALDIKREALQVIKESSSSSRQINANMGQQNEISTMWNSKDNLFEFQTLENFDTESVVSKRSSNDETDQSSNRRINQQLYRMELDDQIKEKKALDVKREALEEDFERSQE